MSSLVPLYVSLCVSGTLDGQGLGKGGWLDEFTFLVVLDSIIKEF